MWYLQGQYPASIPARFIFCAPFFIYYCTTFSNAIKNRCAMNWGCLTQCGAVSYYSFHQCQQVKFLLIVSSNCLSLVSVETGAKKLDKPLISPLLKNPYFFANPHEMLKMTSSWIGKISWISAWLDENCECFTNTGIWSQTNFFCTSF